jgi:hypothetical protein
MKPTPYYVFARIAARLGDIDPTDVEAVQAWFMEELPRRERAEIEAILEELLKAEAAPEAGPVEPFYPKACPLPRLEDSPQATVPGWWSELWPFVRQFVRRRRPPQ